MAVLMPAQLQQSLGSRNPHGEAENYLLRKAHYDSWSSSNHPMVVLWQ